ncbi:tRNA lysidine(34) synthetase TilS [Lacinutrix salivirga]
MLKPFQKHINQNLSFLKGSKLLIAISGGLDSVVLTHLCYQANLKFSLAHCNFNLRGNESNADEDFVLQLAEDLDLEVFIEHFETQEYATKHKLSTQMAARALRYNWFNDLANQLQFDYILTAHHADDNLETFLINFTRGTGLEGLTGIPEINGNIIRPLLQFKREELEGYAKSNSIKWREDSSNATTKYLRNKLRHDVIPVLKTLSPDLLSNFKNTLNNLNDTADIVEESVQAVLKRAILQIDDTQISYKISALIKLNNPKAYLFEIFKSYGFTQWDDIYKLLTAQSGKLVYSATHQLLKDRETLILTQNTSKLNSDTKFIVKTNKQLQLPIGILEFEELDLETVKNANTIHVDKDLLKFPLSVRQWEKGDYFYPFGMQGKKKLSKYFKDEKLSLLDKEKIWILCSENNIVWIIGKRADNRFKVSESTKNILKITIT